MGRARLTDAEREERRRARARHSFSDAAYRHYDPGREGYGSADEWVRAAEEMAGGFGGFARVAGKKSGGVRDKNMVVLGLTELPATLAALKAAFRKVLFEVHPDYGGTDAQTIAALAAFKALLVHYA